MQASLSLPAPAQPSSPLPASQSSSATSSNGNATNAVSPPSSSSRQLSSDLAALASNSTASTTAEESLDLNFDMAASDSPVYRANLQRVDDETEKFASWLDAVVKNVRTYTEELLRLNDTESLLGGKVMPGSSPAASLDILDSECGMAALRTFADGLQCVNSFKAKMIDDFQEYLLMPLTQFHKEDIKEMRDFRRNFDRSSDRYDSAVQRFYGLSKVKDASALREDAFQLYDIRKAYFRTSLEYTGRAIRFKIAMDRLILDQFTDTMESIGEFYQNAADVYKGLRPRIDQLKAKLQQRSAQWEKQLASLDGEKVAVEEKTISLYKPSFVLPLTSTAPSAKPLVGPTSSIEKEGYLFKRSPPKATILVPTWYRRWCYIRDGKFGFIGPAKQRVNLNGVRLRPSACSCVKYGSMTGKIAAIVLKSFPPESIRSLFYLGYTSVPANVCRSFALQAETEAELLSWLEVFEAAKQHAMRNSNDALAVSSEERKQAEVKGAVDEDELDNSNVITPQILRKTASATPKPISEGNSNVKPGAVKYPDAQLSRRNDELHSLLRTVPAAEYVLDSFPSALQKDETVSVQGRVYLTQERICFYSNILGTLTTILIPFTEITSIQRRTASHKNGILIATRSTQYLFTTFFRDNLKTYGALNTAYSNAQCESPMPVQELLDTVYSNYRYAQMSGDEMEMKRSKSKTRKADLGKLEESKSSQILETGASQAVPSVASSALSSVVAKDDWPADVPVPPGEVKCGCSEHLEKMEVDTQLKISAKKLFDVLFHDGTFFEGVHTKRKDWDFKCSEWSSGGAQSQREMRWMFAVNNPMTKVKETDCVETQVELKRQEHTCYVVECSSKTVNMPYGDSFVVVVRYCITFVSKDTARLQISHTIKFLKSVLVKGIIKSAAMKGSSEYLADVVQQVRAKVQTLTAGATVVESTGAASASGSISSDASTLIPSKGGADVAATSTMVSPVHSAGAILSVQQSPWIMILLLVSTLFNMYQLLYPVFPPATTIVDVLRQGILQPVYLRDLEEQVLNQTAVMTASLREHGRRESFLRHLQDSSAGNYSWHVARHATTAQDIDRVFRQIRFLRYSVLRSFTMLNDFEKAMMEAEYVNWMTDQIALCWDKNSDLQKLVAEQDAKRDANVAADLVQKQTALQHACKGLTGDLQSFLQQQQKKS